MAITTGIVGASYINHEINQNVQEVKQNCDPNVPLFCPKDTIDIEYAKKALEVVNGTSKVYEDGSIDLQPASLCNQAGLIEVTSTCQ